MPTGCEKNHAHPHLRPLSGSGQSRQGTRDHPHRGRLAGRQGKNPWKSSELYTEADFAALRKDGIASHKLVDLKFTPIAYGTDLIPAAERLNFPAVKLPAPNELNPGRGVQTFLTYIEKGPRVLELKITGGLITRTTATEEM